MLFSRVGSRRSRTAFEGIDFLMTRAGSDVSDLMFSRNKTYQIRNVRSDEQFPHLFVMVQFKGINVWLRSLRN